MNPTEHQIEAMADKIEGQLYDAYMGAHHDEFAGLSEGRVVAIIAARLAFAALPQPIGYAFAYPDGDVCWSTADDSNWFATQLAANAAADGDPGTVVALLPVEVQP